MTDWAHLYLQPTGPVFLSSDRVLAGVTLHRPHKIQTLAGPVCILLPTLGLESALCSPP